MLENIGALLTYLIAVKDDKTGHIEVKGINSLHNGGIVATFAMVAFYTKVIFDNYKSGNTINNILILAMIVMGLSRTNLIFGNLLILTIFYVYVDKRERNILAYDKFEKIVTGIS